MLNMEVVAPAYFRDIRHDRASGPRVRRRGSRGSSARVDRQQEHGGIFLARADAIGKRLTMGRGPNRTFTVVGVVPDTRYRDLREARASIYFPLRQAYFPFTATTLAIRARGNPAARLRHSSAPSARTRLASPSPARRPLRPLSTSRSDSRD
jgi:hypothetical protein